MKSGSITMPLFGWLIENDLFVYRFLLFTMVFYLHHLEAHNQDIDSSILPIAASTQKKSKDAIKWINAVKLIDKGSRDGSKKENKSRDAVKFINEGSLDGSRKVIDGYALSLNDAMGIHYQIQKKQHFAGSSHLPFRNNWPAQKEIVIPVFIKEECHWLAAVVDIMKKNVNDLVA
ncbi:hypothetical protein L484_000575 [Morus notabilis]|uniref:Ubiquitin-like protease family profile domain-containing protein n=1 Tax=Morus notabilis TaxID=981085 RepID=W9SAK6_9ROSA|nr:hypothetical protein L484_000575 [Morus notabilis]